MLLEEGKKELEEKLERMEVVRGGKGKRVEREGLGELRREYEGMVNGIVMVIVHLERVVGRHLSVVRNVVGIVGERAEFQEFKGVYEKINERFHGDPIRKIVI